MNSLLLLTSFAFALPLGAAPIELEAESFTPRHGARVVDHQHASGGRALEFGKQGAAGVRKVELSAGRWRAAVRGFGQAISQDAFYVRVADNKPVRPATDS